jgi:hypothetical protein
MKAPCPAISRWTCSSDLPQKEQRFSPPCTGRSMKELYLRRTVFSLEAASQGSGEKWGLVRPGGFEPPTF